VNTTNTTKISGYTVEFSICDDSSQCWVEKGSFSASLSALLDLGHLEDRAGREHVVKDCIVDRIYDWALKQGY